MESTIWSVANNSQDISPFIHATTKPNSFINTEQNAKKACSSHVSESLDEAFFQMLLWSQNKFSTAPV